MSTDTPPPAAASKGVSPEILERFRTKVPALVKIETEIGEFYARRPTGEDQWQLLQYQRDLSSKGHESMPPALVVAACLRTADGALIWADVEEGYLFLNTIENRFLTDIFNKVLDITGIGKRAVEIAEKKSSSSQSSDSGTSSPP
jgi:hypothetical protein